MGQGWAQPTMVRGSVDKGVWHQAEGGGRLGVPEDRAWASQGHPVMISLKQPLAPDKR